jgi:hypothetical protein
MEAAHETSAASIILESSVNRYFTLKFLQKQQNQAGFTGHCFLI